MLLTSPCFLKGHIIVTVNAASPNVSLGSKPRGSSGGAKNLLTNYTGNTIAAKVECVWAVRADTNALPFSYPLQPHGGPPTCASVQSKSQASFHPHTFQYLSKEGGSLLQNPHPEPYATKIRTKRASLDFLGGMRDTHE